MVAEGRSGSSRKMEKESIEWAVGVYQKWLELVQEETDGYRLGCPQNHVAASNGRGGSEGLLVQSTSGFGQ